VTSRTVRKIYCSFQGSLGTLTHLDSVHDVRGARIGTAAEENEKQTTDVRLRMRTLQDRSRDYMQSGLPPTCESNTRAGDPDDLECCRVMEDVGRISYGCHIGPSLYTYHSEFRCPLCFNALYECTKKKPEMIFNFFYYLTTFIGRFFFLTSANIIYIRISVVTLNNCTARNDFKTHKWFIPYIYHVLFSRVNTRIYLFFIHYNIQ